MHPVHSRFIRCISYFMCCFHWISTHFDVNTVNSIGESSNNFVIFFVVEQINIRGKWWVNLTSDEKYTFNTNLGKKRLDSECIERIYKYSFAWEWAWVWFFPNMLIYLTKIVHGFLCRREDFFSNLWIRFVHHSHFFPPLKNMCRFSICAVFILDCRRLFIYFSLRNEKMSLSNKRQIPEIVKSKYREKFT